MAPDPEAATAPAPARGWLWLRLRGERQRSEELMRRAVWLQAELENVRKQAERERGQAAQRAAEGLAARLLPVLDSLDGALQAPPDGLAEGLRLVRGELERALAAEGVQAIRAVGQPFDPALHEAVQRAAPRPCRDGEQPGLRVERELRAGYTLRGRLLRPAMVRVVELAAPDPRPEPRPGCRLDSGPDSHSGAEPHEQDHRH